jgi:septum formation protein
MLKRETIILASNSPRRHDYLRMLGLPFTILPSSCEEVYTPGLSPREQAEAIAIQKVKNVAGRLAEQWIVGADTIVALEEIVFGKPQDRADAERMLTALQNRTHTVISAVALYRARDKHLDCRSCISEVHFAPMTKAEIARYLDGGEWEGAAGAYKIQGTAACFISHLSGSYSGVVGLPLYEFYAMLNASAYRF